MDWESFFRDYRKPEFIPGYTILNKLGGGVFGEVYKAKKTSIGKFYAIKFLKLADPDAREDVLRELRAVDTFAQVDHANLVSIEDQGEVCGIPFIVMNYAGDETLKNRMSKGALPLPEATALFRQVLQGVSALHARAIIHFDIKPANVFLKGDVARIGDYGLSKLMTETARTLSMGRGTPAYMAPEMLQRKGDARSDVYSLGAMFFEMLTGQVPFRGESEWEVLHKHASEAVVFPASVPPPLRILIARALDKAPAARYPDAGEMLAALGGEAVAPATGSFSATATHKAAPPPPPPPFPLAGPGRSVGQRVGEAVARDVRVVTDAVTSAKDQVRGALEGVKAGWARGTGQTPVAGGAPVALDLPRPPALPRRRGPFMALITFPFRLIGMIFSNLASAVLTVTITVLCCLGANLLIETMFS